MAVAIRFLLNLLAGLISLETLCKTLQMVVMPLVFVSILGAVAKLHQAHL